MSLSILIPCLLDYMDILGRSCMLITSGSYLFNPLHPKISMHILHTVLYTFPKVLTRRICLPIKRFHDL